MNGSQTECKRRLRLQSGRSRTGTKIDKKTNYKNHFQRCLYFACGPTPARNGEFQKKKVPFSVACNLPVARLLLTIVENKKSDSFSPPVILPVARLLLKFCQFPRGAKVWRRKRSRPLGNHLRRGKPLLGNRWCVDSGMNL